MTDEDRTAEKLKGNNCLIKFRDGEELMLYISELDDNDDTVSEWLLDAEKFINGDANIEYFPGPGISLTRNSVKYIKKL